MAPTRKPTQPACDACHIRRVKCSHEHPCAHCSRLGLNCTYHKAGQARKSTGKRIEMLRETGGASASGSSNGSKGEESGDPAVAAFAAATAGVGMPAHASNGGGASGAGPSRAGAPARLEHEPQGPFPFDGPPPRSGGRHPGDGFSPRPSNGHLMMPPPDSPRSLAMYHSGMPPASSPSASGASDAHSRFRGMGPPSAQHHQTGFPPFGMRGSGAGPSNGSNSSGGGSGGHGLTGSPGPQSILSPRSTLSSHSERHHPYRTSSSHSQPHQAASPSQALPSVHYTAAQNAAAYAGSPSGLSGMPQSPGASFVDQLMGRQPPQQPQQGQFYGASPSAGGLDAGSQQMGMYNFDTGMGATYRLPDLTTSLADSLLGAPDSLDVDALMWGTHGAGGFPLVAGDGSATMLDALGRLNPGGQPVSLDALRAGSQAASGSQFEDTSSSSVGPDEPHALSDSVLIPTLALFYERLSGIMPVFSRAWLFGRLDRDHHHTEPQFGAMLLAMSALVVIQAQDTTDRASARRRRRKAISLLEEATRLRGGLFFGQHPSLEATCTSFFYFASLFALGEHNAAWFRLREAVTLGHLAKLHEPSSYEGLDKDEQERRLRTYWLLAITERAYALQYGHPITLTGNPRARTASLRAKLGLKELADFPDLQLCLFDTVDEAFVDCFLGKCAGKACRNFNREKALELYAAFMRGAEDQNDGPPRPGSSDSAGPGRSDEAFTSARPRSSTLGGTTLPFARSQVQKADYEITRAWLANRAWLISLSHGLLSIEDAEEPLRVDHALSLARSTLEICNTLSLASMEAHGVGFALKLYDLASTLVLLCKDEAIARAISEAAASRSTQGTHGGSHGGSSGAAHSPNQASPPAPRPPGAETLLADTAEILQDFVVLLRKFLDGKHPYLDRIRANIAELQNTPQAWGSQALQALLNELGVASQ